MIESIKPIEEWSVDDWRTAFNALTELYNAAVKRADEAEAQTEVLRSSFISAVETVMNLYSTAANNRVAQLGCKLNEVAAERDRLRLAFAATRRLPAKQ